MSRRSPMSLTLDALRLSGLWADQVERWVPAQNKFTGEHGIRMDLFGFIDIVALDVKRKRFIGVQAAGEGERQSHLRKIMDFRKDFTRAWLQTGGRVLLYTWSKKKIDGRERWASVVDEVCENGKGFAVKGVAASAVLF